jgi:predicted carbohydrate-binding protein with CBM5 and CBM33 domain
MTNRRVLLRTTLSLAAALAAAAPGGAFAHGLMTDPPARNAYCGYITKPDQVANGTAQYPVCGDAFNAPGMNPQAGYSFMSVLTHTTGYAGVGARTNVCSFNSETWSGAATPWDQPINWPTTAISSGPLTITWNISWGPHFDDTQEFRYWITKPDFVWTTSRPLSFSDFESTAFCVLPYSDANPTGNPNVTADKAAQLFRTRCTVPARSGRHVIYGEWGRNQFTFERFHGCIDVTFGGGTTSFNLTVTKAGTGTGTVTANTGGINCGATCSASYASGATVTLTAAAATGSTFAGWSGACTGTAATCAVSMTQARSVTATFNSSTGTTFALSVTKAGTGSGTVFSTPAGINCGTACSASFPSGTVVTLVGDVATGSSFAGWSGPCTGTGPCTVTMSQAQSVTATFNSTGGTMFSLSVTKAGTGSGTVTSNPVGVSCGSTCSASFNSGTAVTLTAAPATGSTFAGWSGACTGTGSCITTMTAARTVTATFNTSGSVTFALTVTKSGTGSGTVTASAGGINCGTVCSAQISSAVTVTLTATAASGSTFAGWSGACTGTAATCTVAMTQARTVNAAFNTSGGTTTPCANPVTFTGNTSNFNTAGAVCYRTSQTVNGWGCSNFAGRTVSVNGGTASGTCGAGPFPLSKASDGYTYFSVSAGTYTWASLYVW